MALCGRGLGGKPVSPALLGTSPKRHWRGRIHSGRLSCYFQTTPNGTLRKGAGGETCFPRTFRDKSQTSLERPDSLRPSELLLPNDSKWHSAEGGWGGNLFPPHF